MAYKPDIDDVRESPAFEIIHLLQAKGAQVEWHDPHVESVYLNDEISYRQSLTSTWLAALDCVIIVTHHRTYDWQFIVDHSPLVIDTRHVTHQLKGQAKIIGL
jgi:UDP-N-acetyl-D-glucosamine dehydrogenase